MNEKPKRKLWFFYGFIFLDLKKPMFSSVYFTKVLLVSSIQISLKDKIN